MERLAKLLFFTALLIYFVVVVVLRTPAEWGAWVASQAAPNLTLTGVSGSLWSGKADSAQVLIGSDSLDLGTLKWELDGMSLLGLKACLDIDSQNVQGYVCRTLAGKNTVQKLLVDQVPAQLLNDLVGVQLGGTGSVTIEKGRFTDEGRIEQLQGNISWQRARVNAGTGWFALGSFGADITDNDSGGVVANVVDLEGDFEVQLQGEFTPGQEPRANGIIKPREGAQQPLVDALSVFTETLDDGSFRVVWPIGG